MRKIVIAVIIVCASAMLVTLIIALTALGNGTDMTAFMVLAVITLIIIAVLLATIAVILAVMADNSKKDDK